MGRTLRNKLVYGKKTSKTILLFILFLAASISLLPGEALAQGTGLDIEDLSLTSGDTATLYLRLTEAIDGLGRLDATIVSNNPDVLQLREIAPEAVSEQFLQIDSQSNKEIKFKLVDLGKNIDPGDTNVQLVSFKVEAVQEGETEIGLEGIKYTDEDGNVIEPKVSPSTVTVSAPAQKKESGGAEEGAEEKEQTSSEESEATKEESKPAKEEPQEQEKGKTDQEGEEPEEKPADTGRNYELNLDGIKLRLGGKGKVALNISSLPEGFRLAETTVISEGVTVDGVNRKKPLYYEVVDHSKDSTHFRVGDFDGEIGPDTSELKLAELNLKALRVGWASLRVRAYIRTDEGREVVRTAELQDIKVYQPAILGTNKPPQDLNGDGLYEDVDGDGELTKKDVFVLAVNLSQGSEGISAPMFDVFDFNEDGVVNFDDAVKLMQRIGENK